MLQTHFPFKHPSVVPTERGLYVRDWRGTQVLPLADRSLSIDLWEPVSDRSDSLFPGVWYVVPGINDATEQRLPWREATALESLWWQDRYPEVRRWLRESEVA